MAVNSKKKDKYISYIKGIAFFSILIIHLCNWGGASNNIVYIYFKKVFYSGLNILFFVSMSGSLIYLAYKDYDIKKASKRLFKRGFKLIGIYYAYSIIKLFIFDFNKENLYSKLLNYSKLTNLINIITLKYSDTGISILFTIGFLLLISPIFLYFIKKSKNPNIFIISLIMFFISLSLIIQPNSKSYLYNLLYSNNFATFPLFLWIIPYLIGTFIAIIGFENKRKNILISSAALTLTYILYFISTSRTINPSIYAYQLSDGSIKFYTYFVFFSFTILSLLIYVFKYVVNINKKISNKILNILEFIGDKTFDLYLIQWIVIDMTYWIFSPERNKLIFITVPVVGICYCIIKYKGLLNKKEAV